jgi:hypothetical protein
MNPEDKTPEAEIIQPSNVPLDDKGPVSPAREQQTTYFQAEPITPQPSTGKRIGGWIAAVLLVVTGIIVTAFIGFIVAFSGCFKSDCSPVEGGAPFWMPVASLFLTVPLAKKILNKTN